MSTKRIVIVGGGHNGLILSALLAEQGAKVTLLEANSKLGGMTDTIEIQGVKLSRASYVLGLMPGFLINKFKIPLLYNDIFQVFYVNDKVIPFYRDSRKRREEMIKAGETRYPEFEDKLLKFKKLLYDKFTFVEKPPTKDSILEEAKKYGLEEFIQEPAKKVLSEYISEDYHEFFIYPGMERTSAYVIAYFFSPEWSLVEGGMGTVSQKIAEYAIDKGVEVRVNSKVEELIVRDDKVVGVRMGNTVVDGDVFVIATSPLQFPELVPNVPKRGYYPGWKKYNVILSDYPRFPEKLKGLENSLLDTEFGELLFPSILDKSRNGVVMETMADLEDLYQMFPDLKSKVKYVDELNAFNAEKIYNLPYGDLNHLPMREEFILEKRLGYETKYDNVYLCSAGTYPSWGSEMCIRDRFNTKEVLY
ncbi:phytoene desaturase family protein [Sulfolobus acidocaldarius]|uniref:phytoene desaturase family protein n=1 Tax=Sulfolobus acidocaldarius TaxID=2285 RepID=UPI001E333F32|nr:NAD(P)/FAD-dependent oxidoreductase [Sulfolobus acidocaldarius]